MADMKLRVNFGDLKKFQEKMIKELGGNGDKVDLSEMMMDTVKTAGKRCLYLAEGETPVDTGQLRKNWKIDDGVKRGWNYTVTIENPVEYASYVEYGHRPRGKDLAPRTRSSGYRRGKNTKEWKPVVWVEGKWMLHKAIYKTKQAMPDLVEEKIIKKFLEITK